MEQSNADSNEYENNLSDYDRLIREEEIRSYMKELYNLHPDNELLARMWEIDPETMSELMPEVGTDAFRVPEVPNWKVTAGIAMNTLRLCFDQWPKETRSPEKRMRDAWQDMQDTDTYDRADYETRKRSLAWVALDDAISRVRAERKDLYKRYLRRNK